MVGRLEKRESRARSQARHRGLQQIQPGKDIAGALKEQHGGADSSQVCVAQFLLLTGGVKRVGEKGEAITAKSMGGRLRSHAPAHRPASDHDRARSKVGSGEFDDSTHSLLEKISLVRETPAGFLVGEIEEQCGVSTRIQKGRHREELRGLTGAPRPRTQDDRPLAFAMDAHADRPPADIEIADSGSPGVRRGSSGRMLHRTIREAPTRLVTLSLSSHSSRGITYFRESPVSSFTSATSSRAPD